MESKNISVRRSLVIPSQDKTVAHSINEYVKRFSQNTENYSIDLATAYFNVSGWSSISEMFINSKATKILLGVKPSGRHDPLLRFSLKERVEIEEANNLTFTLKQEEDLRLFTNWLKRDTVEVRLYNSGFLHGKTITIRGTKLPLAVIIGSSNLTAGGMIYNLEANTLSTERQIVEGTNIWFEEAWKQSVDIKEEVLDIYSKRAYTVEPEQIFMKALSRLLENDIEIPEEDIIESSKWLTELSDFQVAGARKAQAILDKYGGVLLSDDVGLGKTYTGGALVRKAVSKGNRVLIVCPASIKPDWEKYLIKKNIDRNAQVVTYNKISDYNGGLSNAFNIKDINLLVLDEAHWIRNTPTERREAIITLLGNTNAKILCITATPVNNGFLDLHRILNLFLEDDSLISHGVFSLTENFKIADSQPLNNQNLLWMDKLLSQVMVKRTRDYIKNNYTKEDTPLFAPDGTPWRFPVLEKPLKVDYLLVPLAKELITDVINSLVRGNHLRNLSLAVYSVESYIESKPNKQNPTGLIRSMLLKSIESSMEAFAQTCKTLLIETENRLNEVREIRGLLDTGVVTPISEGTIPEVLLEEDKEENENIEFEIKKGVYPPPLKPKKKRKTLNEYSIADLEVVKYQEALSNDLDILTDWHNKANILIQDPLKDTKLIALANLIWEIRLEASRYNTQLSLVGDKANLSRNKIVIFTSRAVTASWLMGYLPLALEQCQEKMWPLPKIQVVTGETSSDKRGKILDAFAPETRDPIKGIIDNSLISDILISTDVLAEGVNLQQARTIIHFDIPWNPMKAIQRSGRVDRLGSKHHSVQNYCFIPPAYIDDSLALLNRVREKMTKANFVGGVRDSLGVIAIDEVFLEVLQEHYEYAQILEEESLEGIQNKDNPRDMESLQLRLRKYLENKENGHSFEVLPLGMGTILHSNNVKENTWILQVEVLREDLPENFTKVFLRTDSENSTKEKSQVEMSWLALELLDSGLSQNHSFVPQDPGTEYLGKLALAYAKVQKEVVTAWNNDISKSTFFNIHHGKQLEDLRTQIRNIDLEMIGIDLEEQRYILDALLMIDNSKRAVHLSAIQEIAMRENKIKPIDATLIGQIFQYLVDKEIRPKNVRIIPEIAESDIILTSWTLLLPETNLPEAMVENVSSQEEMVWLEAAIFVIPQNNIGMTAKEILEEIERQGLRSRGEALTPQETIRVELIRAIERKDPRASQIHHNGGKFMKIQSTSDDLGNIGDFDRAQTPIVPL